MPKDPVMLLSFVNTQLRDNYGSMEDMCKSYNADMEEIVDKLAAIDYHYDSGINQFI